MQILGFILGYLFALIFYLIKRIIKSIFKIFNINIFRAKIKPPQLDIKKRIVDKTELFKKGEETWQSSIKKPHSSSFWANLMKANLEALLRR